MKLADQTAVVTGGGSGIGLAVAAALAREGCRVLIAGRGAERLESAAAAYAGPGQLLTSQVDVANRTSVNELFAQATAQLGRIDILVASAGVNVRNRAMGNMSPDDWDRVMAINATGAYNCMHAVLPQMLERGAGLIVNISSVAGKRASELGGVAYSAAKFAQTALGMAVAREVGGRGVRVSNIYPGEVNTPILNERPKPVSEEHKARILQPEDVAAAVLMIATLPPRAHVAELLIKPVWQEYS